MESCGLLACLLFILECIQRCHSWPEGTYGLPEPDTGCPDPAWHSGYRIQKTEFGSYTSDATHLSGFSQNSGSAGKPKKGDKIMQSFCMKTSYTGDNKYQWQPGQYCIFKKGDCPDKFDEGFVRWDDEGQFFIADEEQELHGVVPDGKYGRNTEIRYCCRTDGHYTDVITLPTHAPFYLFPLERCQEVEGMDYVEEWVYWKEESSFTNRDSKRPHPRMIRPIYPIGTKMYYCHYSQAKTPPWVSTFLVAVYVIGGIIAAIIILVIFLYVVQRCCMCCRHRQERHHNAEMSEDGSIEFYNMRKNNVPPSAQPSAPPAPASSAAIPSAPHSDEVLGPHRERAGLMGDYSGAAGETFTMRYKDEVKPPSYDEVLRQDSKYSSDNSPD